MRNMSVDLILRIRHGRNNIKRPIKALTIRIFVEVGYFMYELTPTSPKCIEASFS